MFGYYWKLGLRSLRRNKVLTALMVITLAIGIAASMTTLTVLHVMSGDPIPSKSDRLFVPQLDNYPITDEPGGEPDQQMTYQDANNLLNSKIGIRRTAIYGANSVIESGSKITTPVLIQGIAPTLDFFKMFEVPFRFGSPWTQDDEQKKSDVIVLTRVLSEKLFGDANPVGQFLKMEDAQFRVVGVIDTWKPQPRYFRLISGNGGNFSGVDEFFIPFQTAVQHEISNSGSNNCSGNGPAPGYQGWLRSECTWIQFWFEGERAADRESINAALTAYTNEQKKLGRFPRPLNNRLRNVMQWMEQLGVVSSDTKLSTWLAFGFLLVCLVNTAGLLFAKFSGKVGEIGVRRALGASRKQVFVQHLIESSVLGLSGGILGLLLSLFGLWILGGQSAEMKALVRMDWAMLSLTIVLAIAASLLAGLLPTWRASGITPAIQLKSQ
jgi:putative ABC transport system permease protein